MTSDQRKSRVKITDVARAAGVSPATVSLVLADKGRVSAATRERVRAVVAELGYVSDRNAANLRRGSSDIIGMVVNDLTNPFFAELTVAIERELSDAGYMVVLANTAEDLDRQHRIVTSFIERGAAGIILSPALRTKSDLTAPVHRSGVPITTVVRPITSANCDHVGSDNEGGMAVVTRHLLEQGVSRLAFVGGNAGAPVYEQRRAGFARAILEAGTNDVAVSFTACGQTRSAAARVVESLMTSPNRPQAIVCYSDKVAFGTLAGLSKVGMIPGRDVLLSGFDDVEESADLNPPLTTVRVHVERMGRIAAKIILDKIAAPHTAIATRIVNADLVVRGTSLWRKN